MEVLAFDPFNIKCAGPWKLVMDEFKVEVLVGCRRHLSDVSVASNYTHKSPFQLQTLHISSH